MALWLRRSSWPCKYCDVALNSIMALIRHVVGENHRLMVNRVAPSRLYEIGRLQYFLDSHLTNEPILGLEYVVERNVDFKYLYRCQLCNVDEEWQEMLSHIIGTDHTARYIDTRHPELAPKPRDFCNRPAYVNALFAVALEVYKDHGTSSISHEYVKVAKEGCKSAAVAKGRSCQGSGPTEKPPKRKKKPMGCKREAKQSESESEIVTYLRNFTARDHVCSLCAVSCPTTVELYEHVTGIVHGGNLACAAPERLKELSRLQHFLDSHMKGEPILGLGYVIETEIDPVYMYTCLLCDVLEDWPCILTHILGADHVARYIDRHHVELMPRRKKSQTRFSYVKALTAVAIRVHKTLSDAVVAEAASEDDGEEAIPLPSRDNVVETEESVSTQEPLSNFLDFPLREITQELQDLGVSKFQKHFCTICCLSLSSAVMLCCHLMGSKHRLMLKNPAPEVLQKLNCLQYFLDTLLKKESLLGLEYVKLHNDSGTTYKYICQLCNVKAYSHQMLLHIKNANHVIAYMKRHHVDDLSTAETLNMSKKILKKHALKICSLGGRKGIQYKKTIICSPTRSTGDKLSPKDKQNGVVADRKQLVRGDLAGFRKHFQKSDVKLRKVCKKRNRQKNGKAVVPAATSDSWENSGTPSGKETSPRKSPLQESYSDAITPLGEVQFSNNADFLEFLRTFNIQNDEDAFIIKQINENCANALKRFLEEQAEGLQGMQPCKELQTHGADV